MADNWQPGDLALCAVPHRNDLGHPSVRPGGVYTVEAVDSWFGEPGLLLAGHHSSHASGCHAAFRFRKINPLNEAERAAAMRELNAPVREPVA